MRLCLLAFAATPLLAALAGCELLKNNEDVLAIINARVSGMSAGDFFDRYGRASSRTEVAGGATEYEWVSGVGFARPGVEALDERICKLHLTSDARGRISRVQVLFDAPGLRSTSRCGEIFAAK